jgi:hypothetical protein
MQRYALCYPVAENAPLYYTATFHLAISWGVSMLRWRLLLGTLIIAALVILCWLDHHSSTPGVYLLPVGLGIVVLASSEMIELLRAAGARPHSPVVYCALFQCLLSENGRNRHLF